MKKLILGLLPLGLSAGFISSVVSCGSLKIGGDVGYRAFLVTDGNTITDGGFNQQAYEGIVDWGNSQKPKKQDLSINYLESKGNDVKTLLDDYKIAVNRGAETLVLPGFAHGATISGINDALKTKKGSANFVMLDASITDKQTTGVGVVFESEMAGFEAGLRAADWATTKDANGHLQGSTNLKDNHIRFGTFAGISNKTGVDNFMWGFIVSVIAWNKLTTDDTRKIALENLVDPNNKGTWANELADTNNLKSLSSPALAKDTNWYSQSFAPGSDVPTINGINKSDVVFPVAGPQINDVVAQIPKAHVIGVDTDEAGKVGDGNRTLLSAGKNINGAVQSMLDKIHNHKDGDGLFGKNYHSSDADGKAGNWSKVFMDNKNIIKEADSDKSISEAIKWAALETAKKDLVETYTGKTNPTEASDKYMTKDLINKAVNKIVTDLKK